MQVKGKGPGQAQRVCHIQKIYMVLQSQLSLLKTSSPKGKDAHLRALGSRY